MLEAFYNLNLHSKQDWVITSTALLRIEKRQLQTYPQKTVTASGMRSEASDKISFCLCPSAQLLFEAASNRATSISDFVNFLVSLRADVSWLIPV